MAEYKLLNLSLANETILKNDIFLILIYATRIPPHLFVSINGKTFTLSVKGVTMDGELSSLLQLIRRKNIETVFIKLDLPPLFTLEHLKTQIRNCMQAYPRADAGIATCLSPINDFCHTIYKTEKKNVNLIFDLLTNLQNKNAMHECYYLNLEKHLIENSFSLNIYTVNDVYEAIHQSSSVLA